MNINNLIQKGKALLAFYRSDPQLARLVREIKKTNKTFLSYPKLLSLSKAFFQVQNRASQQIYAAEFGVGRGGSAMMLAYLIQKSGGTLSLYDLFSRIPPPTVADGLDAQNRYEKIITSENLADYYGNIPDLLSVVKTDLAKVTDLDNVDFVIGKYEETLPALTDNKHFHLVHIDCDWFESTRAVLAYLRTRLEPGAILQFDDYGFWSGSKKAVDETDWLRQGSQHQVGDALVIVMPDVELHPGNH